MVQHRPTAPLRHLFVGDLTAGTIAALDIGLTDRPFGGSLISFGEDAEGEPYVLTTNFIATGGLVQRIVPVPEPSGVALLACGVLGASRRARRR